MLEEIERLGGLESIPTMVQRAKDKNDPFRLMGFGHRVYKSYDPRAKLMRQVGAGGGGRWGRWVWVRAVEEKCTFCGGCGAHILRPAAHGGQPAPASPPLPWHSLHPHPHLHPHRQAQVTYRVLEKLGRKDPLLDIAMELEKIALQDEYFVKR